MLIIAFTMVFASGISVQAETDAADRTGSGQSVVKGFDINLFETEESKSIAPKDIQNLYWVGNRTFLMDTIGTLRGIGGKCLDVSGGSTRNGATVTMYQCHGGPNQQWRLTNSGELRGIGNKCLDVNGSSTRNGAKVTLWNCHGGPNQKWRMVNGGLRGFGNKCLDVNGSRTNNGAKVSLYQCHGGANQKWRFVGKKRPTRRNVRHVPPSSAYRLCAKEGQQCRFSGTGRVAYGVNGRFNYKTVSRSIKCGNATFGDPVRGIPKRCYVRAIKLKPAVVRTQPRQDTPPRRTNNCRPNANQIAVYENSGYRGKCSVRGVGSYQSAGAFGLANDSMSSMRVGQNVAVTLCEHNSFGGKCQTFTRSSPNIGRSRVGNDEVSSIKVVRRRRTAPVRSVPRTTVRAPAVSIKGRNLRHVEYIGGYFNYVSNRRWAEYKKGRRTAHATFVETQRDEWSVYLRKSDGARVQLDLHTKQVNLNGRKLYSIIRASTSARYPAPVRNVNNLTRPNHAPPRTTGSPFIYCSEEDKRCTFRGERIVACGVNGKFKFKRGVRGGIDCNNRTFGDPVKGVRKRCYAKLVRKIPVNRPRHSPPNSRYVRCAVEGGRCNLPRRTTFAYGVNGRFNYKRNVSSVVCNNKTFGDPVRGVKKRCYFLKQNIKPRVVNGRNVGIVNYSGGTFTKSSTGKKWLVYKKGKRGIHATFTETGRDEWSVYLRKSDGARIQLDLHTKLISINGRKLYTIVTFY